MGDIILANMDILALLVFGRQMRALEQRHVFRIIGLGRIHGDIGFVLQGRFDPPVVVQMPVGNDHELDLAAFQHGGDVVLLVNIVHPIVVPPGIQKNFSLFSLQSRHGQKGHIAAGIVPIPRDIILVGHCPAVIQHVFFQVVIVEPTGLAEYIHAHTFDFAEIYLFARPGLAGQRPRTGQRSRNARCRQRF